MDKVYPAGSVEGSKTDQDFRCVKALQNTRHGNRIVDGRLFHTSLLCPTINWNARQWSFRVASRRHRGPRHRMVRASRWGMGIDVADPTTDVPDMISTTLQSHKQVELMKLVGSSVAYAFDHSRMHSSVEPDLAPLPRQTWAGRAGRPEIRGVSLRHSSCSSSVGRGRYPKWQAASA